MSGNRPLCVAVGGHGRSPFELLQVRPKLARNPFLSIKIHLLDRIDYLLYDIIHVKKSGGAVAPPLAPSPASACLISIFIQVPQLRAAAIDQAPVISKK